MCLSIFYIYFYIYDDYIAKRVLQMFWYICQMLLICHDQYDVPQFYKCVLLCIIYSSYNPHNWRDTEQKQFVQKEKEQMNNKNDKRIIFPHIVLFSTKHCTNITHSHLLRRIEQRLIVCHVVLYLLYFHFVFALNTVSFIMSNIEKQVKL